MIKICDSTYKRLGIVRAVTSSSRFEELNGENTMDFEAALTPRNMSLIGPYSIFEVYGQYFDVGSLSHGKNDDGSPVIKVEGDHVSYRLNQEQYDMVPYEEYTDDEGNVTGNNGGFKPVENISPSALLSQILAGTGFNGSISTSVSVIPSYSISGETTRRQMLTDLIDMAKGEATYNNFNITIVGHRGTTARKVAIIGKNVTSLSKEVDRRSRVPKDEQATKPYFLTYNCQIIDNVASDVYNIGDDVRIIDRDLGIDSVQRVVSISSNPDDDNEPRVITLGDLSRRKFEYNLDGFVDDKVEDKEDEEDEEIDFSEIEDQLKETDANLQDQIDTLNNRIDGIVPPEPAETMDRIHNLDSSQMIVCGTNDISITNSGTTYSLQLKPGASANVPNGTPLIKMPGGDILKLSNLDTISYSETAGGTGVVTTGSSVVCTDTELMLSTGTDPAVSVILKGGSDGDVLVAKQDSSTGDTKRSLQFGSPTKAAFTETDQHGQEAEKSAIECMADRLSLKVADKTFVTNLAGNATGKCLLGVNSGTANVLLFDFLKKLAYAVETESGGSTTTKEKSSVECTETAIKWTIGATSYELDLANGQDGYELVRKGNKIMFQASGVGARANIEIVTTLPSANTAAAETLYLLYDE